MLRFFCYTRYKLETTPPYLDPIPILGRFSDRGELLVRYAGYELERENYILALTHLMRGVGFLLLDPVKRVSKSKVV